MNINIDTDKMRESAKDIMSLSNELTAVLDDMFDKLTGISKSRTWIGASADQYAHRVNIEKNNFIQLSKTLFQYGKVLNDAANDYDTEMKKLEYKS